MGEHLKNKRYRLRGSIGLDMYVCMYVCAQELEALGAYDTATQQTVLRAERGTVFLWISAQIRKPGLLPLLHITYHESTS